MKNVNEPSDTQLDAFAFLVRSLSELEGTNEFQAACKLTGISTLLGAHGDVERFAEIGRARMLAGEK